MTKKIAKRPSLREPELPSSIKGVSASTANSIRQAEMLSSMLHSDDKTLNGLEILEGIEGVPGFEGATGLAGLEAFDGLEGLSSIQKLLREQPVNVLTLVRLINLERQREPGRIEQVLSASAIGLKGANALHDKPGGSREKRAAMREIWATGKYTTKDRCAEEEYEGLGISFSMARKALRKAPVPEKH